MQQIARDTPSCVEWLCCTLQFCLVKLVVFIQIIRTYTVYMYVLAP